MSLVKHYSVYEIVVYNEVVVGCNLRGLKYGNNLKGSKIEVNTAKHLDGEVSFEEW